MPGSKTPRASLRSSNRASPATAQSATSTPTSGRASRLRQSTTPATPQSKRSATANGKTSPYFAKTAAKGKGKGKGVSSRAVRAGKRNAAKPGDEDGDEDEDEVVEKAELLSNTGMTETSDGSDSEADSDDFDPSDDEEGPASEAVESDEEELDSDHLDSEDEDYGAESKKGKKRKSTGGGPSGGESKTVKLSNGKGASSSNSKGKNTVKVEGYEDEEFQDLEIELEEGQEIAGRMYPAPKTGQVPPGRISQNTLNFLKNLQIPERNDRDWFRSHEPAFRQAENEWKAFVGMVQEQFHEADEEVPQLPPRDVIHRIYRDVRFSSDKTPYKKSFSMTTSRGGRKGDWAAYHLSISPNDRSILAAGVWMPGKNELASIRQRFLTDPAPFRRVIGSPDFVRLFGKPEPHKKGERQNVFGHDDALKVAPKIEGVDKNHKDIDLLKLRSIAVVHKFSDEEVLRVDFREQVKDVVDVMMPFVHLLNDYITLPDNDAAHGNDEGDANGDDGDDEE